MMRVFGGILLCMMAAGNADAMSCQSVFTTFQSDRNVLNFLEGGSSLRAGEWNAYILHYFEGHLGSLSPTGAITLIRALRPEGPASLTVQFSPHMPRDYARKRMISLFLERNAASLGEEGVARFKEAL